MDIQEALKIVRALANGVDPETCNKLEDGSVCRRPLAIKALNRAIGALVQEEQRERRKPANAFRAWTGAEDAQVCEELRKGIDLHEIAKMHNRTVPAIVARLVKFGEIAPRSSSSTAA